jgi:hypothetical protein
MKSNHRYFKKARHTIKHKKHKRVRRGGKKEVAATKTAKFKKAQCAPKTDNDDEIQKYSCYSEKDLIKMKDLWNARHRDMSISDSNPRDIWSSLKAKMENACHTEACWLKQKFMENNLNNEELTTYTFAPKSPEKWKENHNTWLNSTDIEKVMKQYEHTYPCFRFIGPTPIDFDTQLYDKKCVWEELCNFDLNKHIKDGINKFGIIFNTDPHTKGGAHWISLFINLKKKFIFFFDSNGTRMPKEIKAFCQRVMQQANLIGLDLTIDQNAPFPHQEGNTECGMYSLYLIITLLKDKHNYNFFKTTKISDSAMENMRDKYFNPEL